MKTNRLLIVIVVLQAFTLAGQWLEGPKMLPSAQGQAFNSAADRQDMIEQLKSLNSKLDRMVGVLVEFGYVLIGQLLDRMVPPAAGRRQAGPRRDRWDRPDDDGGNWKTV